MQKLYCYVDESGQDTHGKFFIVTIAIIGDDRDELLALCERIEQTTKKGKAKWHRASPERRLAYLTALFSDQRFIGKLHYTIFRDRSDYDNTTVMAIAQALKHQHPDGDYTAIVYVDGLQQGKRLSYGAELRRHGIHTRKVQGVAQDESNALIRLVDALAGFIREVITEKAPVKLKALFEKALTEGMLTEE